MHRLQATQNSVEATTLSHVPELDGIRGVAILAVLVYHSFKLAPGNAFHNALMRIVFFGWAGVDLFFVLSGFLITGILLETRESPQYFKSFYSRRALRIFPLYYGALLVYFHVVVPLVHAAGYWPEISSAGEVWFWTYLVNWRAAAGFEYKNISHFWSLAVEEQFYLLWPTVVILVSRKSLRWLCLAMIAAALILRMVFLDEHKAWVFLTPMRMDALASGALVAVLVRNKAHSQILERWRGRVAGIACVLLAPVLYLAGSSDCRAPYLRTWGLTLLCLIFGVTVAHCALRSGSPDVLCRMMRTRFLSFMGRYSYAIYVIHLLVAYLCIRGQGLILGRVGYKWQVLFAPITTLVVLAVSSAVALASWNLFEKPCLDLKRYFPYFPVSSKG